VAIKQIVKKDLTQIEIDDIRVEIDIMKISTHNYVVRLLDNFECKDYFHFVLEKEHGGTMYEYLSAR